MKVEVEVASAQMGWGSSRDSDKNNVHAKRHLESKEKY